MNVVNMVNAICIMERAEKSQSLKMTHWQTGDRMLQAVATEEELHACGNKACFAGHIAISPEWIGSSVEGKRVYSVDEMSGMPVIYDLTRRITYTGAEAISVWLGISLPEATGLVYGEDQSEISEDDADYSDYYKKDWNAVTPRDVIAKLEGLMEEAGCK